MSDFSTLKNKRRAKETKSFVTASSTSVPAEGAASQSQAHDDGATSNSPEVAMQVDSEEKQQAKSHDAASTSAITITPLDCDGLYKSLPPTLEVRMSTGATGNGRGLYSKYYRRPGDVLLSIKPHVAALSNEHLEDYCSNCCAPKTTNLQRCTGCKLLHYCDSKCQSSDWSFHRYECAAIQRWSATMSSEKSGQAPIPGDAIRCLGRILWRRRKLGSDSIWSREIDSMQSHRKSISKDPNSQDSQTYTQLAHAIVRFLGLESQEELAEYNLNNAGELVDLISRFTTNTFTVSTPALAPLGACVSPLVALINHSCDPNAVVVFPRANSRREDEPLMQVIALKHIAPDEEVLTAYIDTTLPREHRQKILNETYHFTCRCPLCAPPPANSTLDMREAMWCPKKCGGMCPLPTEENSLTRCNRCKTPVKDTDAVLDAVRVGQEALHKAEALQFTNPTKSIQLTTKLVPILVSVGLVPAAYPLLALSRLCASLLISHLSPATSDVEEVLSPELQSSSFSSSSSLPAVPMNKRTPEEQQEALDDAIRAATRASSGLSLILVEGHPVRGVALAELGKLLAVDEPCPAGVEPGSQGVSSPGAPAISPSPPSPSPSPTPLTMQPTSYPPSGPPRLKLAYETLVRARAELLVGFGNGKNEGGEVGRAVRTMAVDVERELGVWRKGVRDALDGRGTRRRG
ncbi:Histone-lysine N-methyltransferase ASHR1 [Psilocybe cubensis]|uniref:Histone-lysine N-methyltransferase ASHR1 n=2 Tax=Psilocybe cubensis TaxID=181762 RepID=A0ACB8GPN8_PSICU|nr:Histone-lysine N-methyltransferase ASHR1 [Psilocybe cubensis]KAH9477693.1 Histone-lysine N-methyltransferase ASHR1 [Psilocybe cubensis]